MERYLTISLKNDDNINRKKLSVHRLENLQSITQSENILKINNLNKIKQKSVKKNTLDDIFIKEYESATAAAIDTDVGAETIKKCTRGLNSTSGGFKWEYCNNFNKKKT